MDLSLWTLQIAVCSHAVIFAKQIVVSWNREIDTSMTPHTTVAKCGTRASGLPRQAHPEGDHVHVLLRGGPRRQHQPREGLEREHAARVRDERVGDLVDLEKHGERVKYTF